MVLALLSPAKTMDFSVRRTGIDTTTPAFEKDAAKLADTLATLDTEELGALMKLSPKLAQLNADRFGNFSQQEQAPAILAYKGDTYQGLAAHDLSDADLAWAQHHIGILTGLYGVLRPLDLIRPYRLEMGTKLAIGKHPNVYAYWGNRLTAHLDTHIAKHKIKAVIGCASNEYLSSIDTASLAAPFIQCEFKEIKNGKPVIVGLFAKRARGAMARYIVTNRITDPQKIMAFNTFGYAFDTELSTPDCFVFTR